MGAPSDQFLHLLWRPPYVLFSYYMGALRSFFAYYIGAPRSLSSLTIWGPSDQFLLIQYRGPSQISFIVYYMPPPPQISFFACYRGATSDFIFFKKYTGASSDQFLRLLYGVPLRLHFFAHPPPPAGVHGRGYFMMNFQNLI